MKPKLFVKFNHELSEEEIRKFSHTCVFCGKGLMLLCGSPSVSWFGCCVGYETPKGRIMCKRVAHVECFAVNYNWREQLRLQTE